jgi:Domain of unknown function (DUF6249)
MHEPASELLALMIPILGVTMGIGLAMLGLWFDYRRKKEMFELHHKERMVAIEKGMEVPPLPVDFFYPSRKRRPAPGDLLRRGLILLFVGAAIMVALSQEANRHYWWGLIPVALGSAYFISYFVERNRPPERKDPSVTGERPADV